MTPSHQIIAIDGPAASGKTTAASELARRLGFLYVNTGAMYRAIALKALRKGISPEDSEGIERLLDRTEVGLHRRGDGSTAVTLDGDDVSEAIKSHEVSHASSVLSRFAPVRRRLVAEQRRIAAQGGTVAEGRDTTTVVFPDAKYKFFIDASLETRAERRRKELLAQGIPISLDEVREDLRKRDLADQTRELSPLKKDPGAVLIDSTNLSPEEVIDQILQHLPDALKTRADTHPPKAEGHGG
ncbi:MAG: (d)CMP kinase [bacterium]|nr:(d)CMP kinase [bacterium]